MRLLMVVLLATWGTRLDSGQPALACVVSDHVLQGQTLRVTIPSPGTPLAGVTARFCDRAVPLFRQESGEYLALVPVRVDQPPGAHTLEIVDASGTMLVSVPVEVRDATFPRQNVRVSKQMQELRPMPGEMEAVRGLQGFVSEKRLWTEPFRSPTPDCMNSPFGVLRFHNGVFTGNYHRGVDLRSPTGRPVRAPSDGFVKIAQMFQLHGGTVGLDHGQGVTSIYIHLSRIKAQEGEFVRQGDIVGWVGATGFATGPHLHWGLYVHGLPVNPTQWIPDVAACAPR